VTGRALVFVAALAACAPAAALAGAVDAFLAFTSGNRTATARFEQQVLDRTGRTVERSTGSFAFSRPGKFRWAYDKPLRSVIVADGAKLWIHDEDLNQVTVKAMDRALSATPAALLAGKDDVTAVFSLREAGSEGGFDWLEAVPKDKDTGFDRVRVGMKGGVPAAMDLHDALGGRTLLRFPEFRANAKVDPETFRFVPPKGADVLDETAARPAAQGAGASPRKP
jgi:outer membrane lipoprotein carrier protein